MDGLGERAEVQADDGVFQPALHARDMKGNGVRVQRQGVGGWIEQDEIGGGIGHGVVREERARSVVDGPGALLAKGWVL